MRLMITVAYDYLTKKTESTFEELFEEIKKEQKKHWENAFQNKTKEQVEDQKRGELFTYLTTDGRFIMVDSLNWGLVENYPFEEIKKMRVHIGENKE